MVIPFLEQYELFAVCPSPANVRGLLHVFAASHAVYSAHARRIVTTALDTPNHWPYATPLYEAKVKKVNLPVEATECEMAGLLQFCLDSEEFFGMSFGEFEDLLARFVNVCVTCYYDSDLIARGFF